MPDLPPPLPPAQQVALRRRVEAVLGQHADLVTFAHQDRFWESDDGSQAVYGWGIRVTPRRVGTPFEVWFDGLDDDIAVFTDARDRRPRAASSWHEWRDLSDLDVVLDGVDQAVRELLQGYQ